jgi:hypothetical protein
MDAVEIRDSLAQERGIDYSCADDWACEELSGDAGLNALIGFCFPLVFWQISRRGYMGDGLVSAAGNPWYLHKFLVAMFQFGFLGVAHQTILRLVIHNHSFICLPGDLRGRVNLLRESE